MQSTRVNATVLSEKSELQNPLRCDHIFGKPPSICMCTGVCTHICVYVNGTEKTSEMQLAVACTLGTRRSLLLLACFLHFQNNKNAIKIKEKLVSISDFLFTLKIQRVFS